MASVAIENGHKIQIVDVPGALVVSLIGRFIPVWL